MSGGYFNYEQYYIDNIADAIENVIDKSGKEKTREELKDVFWKDDEWFEKYPEDLYHTKYSDEVLKELKKGLKYLRISAVYAKRIDKLLSGDDGDKTFIHRLKRELRGVNKLQLMK